MTLSLKTMGIDAERLHPSYKLRVPFDLAAQGMLRAFVMKWVFLFVMRARAAAPGTARRPIRRALPAGR
jgi:hypothetical protein